MRAEIRNVLLVLIFVLALGTRLYFSVQSDTLTYDSYLDSRQVMHIKNTGFPVFSDELSYGGRDFLFSPVFHYVLAFFLWLIPFEIVLKILPNIFSASVVVLVYLFTKQITKNDAISLFTALASAFIPIHFVSNLHSISSLSMQIPLLFLALYAFLMSDKKKYMILFVILTFMLPLVDGTAILLILTFVLYLSLGKIAGYKVQKKKIELIMFFIFIVLWILLIFYKKAFLMHGFSIIWQNIPFVIRNQYFVKTTIIEIVLSIGLLPILSGAYTCYLYVLRIKDKSFYLLLSLALCLLVSIWGRLIMPIIGLSMLGLILIIFSGALLNIFLKYILKTKFSKFRHVFITMFVLIFILNLLSLSWLFSSNFVTLSQQEMHALTFLAGEEKGTVLASYELGHAITAISGQPNVADTSFFLVSNVEQRLDDINTVYTTPFALQAVGVLDKYDAKYLYVPKDIKLKYIEERCFDLIYDGSIKIYDVTCELKEGDKT